MEKEYKLVPISKLSTAEDISTGFLEQIFYNLKKAGIVRSTRGPNGGFSFVQPHESITVYDILNAAGEEMVLIPCVDDNVKVDCVRGDICISHKVFEPINRMVGDYLKNITVANLLEDFNGPSFLL
ncbi:MAG: Rrf2 family transcriptional regulator [Treponema sp.]|nr:Rrf2 family transcriptional regulator [Treponema sp.]